MRRPRRLNLIKVVWRDAFDESVTWHPHSEALPGQEVIVTSVGWEIEDARDGYLVIANSRFQRDSELVLGGLFNIPVGMVIEKETVARG